MRRTYPSSHPSSKNTSRPARSPEPGALCFSRSILPRISLSPPQPPKRPVGCREGSALIPFVQLRTEFCFATCKPRCTLRWVVTRPSDDTREHTLRRLRGGYVSGRLDTETLQRRVECALGSSDSGELAGLTADLPAPRRVRWRDRLQRRPSRLSMPDVVAGRLVLGRSPSCQLVLGDDTVSRRHAELRIVDGIWMLRDLGSSNGTWVNGRRVVRPKSGRATRSPSATAGSGSRPRRGARGSAPPRCGSRARTRRGSSSRCG